MTNNLPLKLFTQQSVRVHNISILCYGPSKIIRNGRQRIFFPKLPKFTVWEEGNFAIEFPKYNFMTEKYQESKENSASDLLCGKWTTHKLLKDHLHLGNITSNHWQILPLS